MRTDVIGTGVGTALIRHALGQLRNQGFDTATYGSAIVHTTPDVVFVKTRVAWPWLSTSILLHGPTSRPSLRCSHPRLLRRALEETGFRVHEMRTLFSTDRCTVTSHHRFCRAIATGSSPIEHRAESEARGAGSS